MKALRQLELQTNIDIIQYATSINSLICQRAEAAPTALINRTAYLMFPLFHILSTQFKSVPLESFSIFIVLFFLQ
jgi:hypothetical protein